MMTHARIFAFFTAVSSFANASNDQQVTGKCAIGISLAIEFLIENDHSTYEENERRHFKCQSFQDSVAITVLNFDQTYLVAKFYSSFSNGNMILTLSRKNMEQRWSKILDPSYWY